MDETVKTKDGKEFKITGGWDQQSKTLKEKYPQLTVEDLKFEPGKEKTLVEKLMGRLQKGREEVIHILRKNMNAIN